MVEHAKRLLEEVEFTHRWYHRFLQRLAADGYDFRTFSEGFGEGDVLLRHDVDLSVEDAVTMAHVEAELGVESTYCVLLTSPLYNPLEGTRREALREISELGHEVALHFSTHEYWPADDPPGTADIERRVEDERAVLETVVDPTETVSFHRPPEWVLDRAFDGFRNTYAPAYFSEAGYVADSGQRWRQEPPPMDDLPAALQVLTHPGLWGDEDAGFDRRVESAVNRTCRHASRKARTEFTEGGVSR